MFADPNVQGAGKSGGLGGKGDGTVPLEKGSEEMTRPSSDGSTLGRG